MKITMLFILLFSLFSFVIVDTASVKPNNPQRWNTLSIKFKGPNTHENDTPNPFTDYRLDVIFTHQNSNQIYTVPGFYAADGNAAYSSASSGNVWMVRFTPNRIGKWLYNVSFHTGPYIATELTGGQPVFFHGQKGQFDVIKEDNYKSNDLRNKGRLQYIGQRYLRFSNGEYNIKLGTNTPENFLGYTGFDGEERRKLSYESHLKDWNEGDPKWGSDNKGKEIIGAINYLASKQVNSLFSILNTVKGDSKGQVHPWITKDLRTRYDVSRLEQWQIVFEHAQSLGLSLNLALLETENEALFEHESGISKQTGFANSRKVYYREIISRFSHNLGFTITLGEENGWNEKEIHGGGAPWGQGNSEEQRVKFTRFLRILDPYDSPIQVHTFPSLKDDIYKPMLGSDNDARVEGASLQMGKKWTTYRETREWISQSIQAGLPWVVTADEIGADDKDSIGGVPLDGSGNHHVSFRAIFCWGNVLAGGGGVEVFAARVDQSLNDFRLFNTAWEEFSRPKLLFYKHNIPFWAMDADVNSASPRKTLTQGQWMFTFSKPGDVYLIYQSEQLSPVVDLSNYKGKFQVRWFNPRKGSSSDLQEGSVQEIKGGENEVVLGDAPSELNLDWVIVIARSFPLGNKAMKISTMSPRDLIPRAIDFGEKESRFD